MKESRKNYLAGLWVSILVLSVGFGPGIVQAEGPGPTVAVSPSVAPIDKKANIIIMGSGFEPDQEISILFQDAYGALSVVKEVKANTRGSWASVWTLGRHTRRGIIKNGVYSIMAADSEYNVLATAPVGFVKPTGDPKKWPKWATAAKIKPRKKKAKKK